MINKARISCTVCAFDLPSPEITFGNQPPSNRFMPDYPNAVKVEKHNLSLSTCINCGTVQLFDRMPMESFRPRYDWLAYNEPEGHLDDVATKLTKLPGINSTSRFMGITYKDQSTLTRLVNKGFVNTVCIQDSDLECSVSPFGLETVQAVLSDPISVNRLKARFGSADVLLVRHITEHSLNSSSLLKSLSSLVTNNGYIMLELPDSERIFNLGNYPFIWEEHISYFTESTARRLAQEVNAEVVWLGRYSYSYEDSLNIVLRFNRDFSKVKKNHIPIKLPNHTSNFFNQFSISRDRWYKRLEDIRSKKEKVAVFGAGHLAVKFINFFELSDLITCVIDDHPNKVGMYMPGSGLQIIPSSQLLEKDIRYCISTLSPESEIKVRKKLDNFFEKGGIFIPAFNTV